jgi:nicotinic acid mononucleotide adenylyltransferase
MDVQNRITSIAQTPGMATIPVWLTQLPRFADKSDFFHGITFLVGTDTLKRIASHHYYCDTVALLDAAIDRLIVNRCRFLCFARKNVEGEIETAETLDLPETLRQIIDFIPVSEFCDDISSTQLRVR